MKPLSYLFILLTFSACSDQEATQELKQQLADKSSEVQSLQSTMEELTAEANAPLTHFVFFKLKPTTSTNDLITELKKLDKIEVVKDLNMGLFEDLGDDRAMSEYDVVMEMSFDNEADYKTYQAHQMHLDL